MTDEQQQDQLDPAHRRALLEGSAIEAAVVARRGYRTVHTKTALGELGFSRNQQRVPALLIPMYGQTGEVVSYQVRPDEARVNKQGKAVKYELPAKSRMVLDIHPDARDRLADPSIPLFVTEGVKKGDALVSRGCCAVALLGVWNWRGTNGLGGKTALPEWESIALNDRRIYIVYDSDVMTKTSVYGALARLKAFLESRGADVALIYLPAGDGGTKVGVDDFLAAGHNLDDLLGLATPTLRPSPEEGGDPGEEAESQADRLVAIGEAADLFHDELGVAHAAFAVNDHREVWPVRSLRFKQWLRLEFRRGTRRTPNADAVRSAVEQLAATAEFDGKRRELHNRVAWHEGAIWYDLADAEWRAVRIDEFGWEIVSDPPILFRREAHQRPQVAPEMGGTLDSLFEVLNVPPRDHLLTEVTVVCAFVPDIPHPVQGIHGPKGAGKTEGQRTIGSLIDPSATPTLSFPSDERELVQQLAHHFCPVYDNVDRLTPAVSDMLCRAVTGEGSSKRKLYSDDEDVIYHYRRVLLLNGVNVVAQRPDLLDRSILIELERIPPSARRTETDLHAAFDRIKAPLLGAIFTALSGAMRVEPEIRVDRLGRMADFTRWGAAVAVALGVGQNAFLDAYRANQLRLTKEAVDGHLVGAAIMALMDDEPVWEGSMTELLAALIVAGAGKQQFRLTASGKPDVRGWPGGAHILSRRLTEVRSNLLDLGVEVEVGRGDDRWVRITPLDPQGAGISDGSDGSDGLADEDGAEADATDATDATSATLQASLWEAVIQ